MYCTHIYERQAYVYTYYIYYIIHRLYVCLIIHIYACPSCMCIYMCVGNTNEFFLLYKLRGIYKVEVVFSLKSDLCIERER